MRMFACELMDERLMGIYRTEVRSFILRFFIQIKIEQDPVLRVGYAVRDAVHFQDFFGDGQAEPGTSGRPLAGGFPAVETVPYFSQLLLRDMGAFVFDAYFYTFLFFRDGDENGPFLGRITDRVRQEIDQDLTDPELIADDFGH